MQDDQYCRHRHKREDVDRNKRDRSEQAPPDRVPAVGGHGTGVAGLSFAEFFLHKRGENRQKRDLGTDAHKRVEGDGNPEGQNRTLHCRHDERERQELFGALLVSHAAQAGGYDQGSGDGTEEKGDEPCSFRPPRRLRVSAGKGAMAADRVPSCCKSISMVSIPFSS